MRTDESYLFRSLLLTKRALPLFIYKERKYQTGVRIGLLMLACYFLLYFPSNYFHLYPPKLLSFSWIDSAVPFIPESVWMYCTCYLFPVVVYILSRDMDNLSRYCYSFFTLQLITTSFFIAWPTTYPRELFPLTYEVDIFTKYLITMVRELDSPANCCPSQHVSIVYLSSFVFLNEQRKKFLLFFSWATLISISTLTTKQHYLIDIITGLFLAVFLHWLFHKRIAYRREPLFLKSNEVEVVRS